MESWSCFLKRCCSCHFSESKHAFPLPCLPGKKPKLQNWFNPFVIWTWRVRVTCALSPEICCYVCTKWVLFIVPCHSLRAWKLAFLFEAVFRKDCKYISGSFDFWKSSCSTSERCGEKPEEQCSPHLFLGIGSQTPPGWVPLFLCWLLGGRKGARPMPVSVLGLREHFTEHLVAKIWVIKMSIHYLHRKCCLSERYFDKFFLYKCQFGCIWGWRDEFFFI